MTANRTKLVAIAGFLLCGWCTSVANAQAREDAVVRQATSVLNEIMAIQASGIPQTMLAKSEGVVIIPNMIKGGFVVGVRHGRGIVLVRDENRMWLPPQFVTMTGGSVGWQAGLQATDVVLVFQTRNSIEGLLRGKFTIGVDAAASAGPVGRQASAGTDLSLKSEIYSYNRSRGLFVGASVDGSSLQIDPGANQRYYASTGLTPTGQATTNTPVLPESAAILLTTISKQADNMTIKPAAELYGDKIIMSPQGPQGEHHLGIDPLRVELAAASNRLARLLDEPWRNFLALPPEVFGQGQHPNPQSLRVAIARFEQVSTNPAYGQLTQLPEFQNVLGLLTAYTESLSALAAQNGALSLPPPPMAAP